MTISHYIGFDVHKKSISYCVKTADGTILEEGKLRAMRQVLREWGPEAAGAVARGDGSHAVQRLDLRCAEAVCGQAGDGGIHP
jgi:hypothetical protein